MRRLLLGAAGFLAMGQLSCGGDSALAPLALSAPLATVIYTCIPITVTATVPFTAALTVTLSGAATGEFFASLDDCRFGAATSMISIASGTTTVTGYYRTKSTDTVALTATSGDLSATHSLTPTRLEVLGQDSLDAFDVAPALNGTRIADPHNVVSDGTRLFVVDQDNHRVLSWSSLPTADGQPADFALGQTNLTSAVMGSPATASTLVLPVGVDIIGGKLFVGEKSCRVLSWESMPTRNGQAANSVLGQPNLTSEGCATTATEVSDPHAIASDGTRLFVADNANCRVLVWNSIPTTNGVAANFALGQATGPGNLDDGDCSIVNGSRFGYPADVLTADGKLFVMDGNRILVWNSIPTAAGIDADFALGQAAGPTNLSADDANQGGGPTASTLNQPDGMATDGRRLLVADGQNNRVLVWDTLPTTAGQPADRVFGQPDFTSNGINNPTRATGLGQVQGIHTDGVRFFVTDKTNQRVRVFPLF